MSSECNHDCSHCSQSEGCESKPIEKLKMKEGSSAKKIIGIVSGKGGVGKSFTTSYLAVLLARQGYRVGILDADITGPSIPFAFGIKGKALGSDEGIFPQVSMGGIKVISSNMFLDNDNDPIIWRGPMIGSLVEQFYTDVLWEELDYLLIDMPPGTGDVALTTFQKIPLDALVLVSSPQGLVKLIVEKAAKMAQLMNIKISALVTNMSYVLCPKCKERIDIFGKNLSKEIAKEYDIKTVAEVPFSSEISESVEEGLIEKLDVNYLDEVKDTLMELLDD
ncbi:MAG TPA: ATP-binding protein [Firmicutes bacterium]|nr:ATP-binding protein [Bacillota bacterium]